jgi:hypothetical protein
MSGGLIEFPGGGPDIAKLERQLTEAISMAEELGKADTAEHIRGGLTMLHDPHTKDVPVGMAILHFTVPCAPSDVFRDRCLRVCLTFARMIREQGPPGTGETLGEMQARGGPLTGLPLAGIMRDEEGLCGSYLLELKP